MSGERELRLRAQRAYRKLWRQWRDACRGLERADNTTTLRHQRGAGELRRQGRELLLLGHDAEIVEAVEALAAGDAVALGDAVTVDRWIERDQRAEHAAELVRESGCIHQAFAKLALLIADEAGENAARELAETCEALAKREHHANGRPKPKRSAKVLPWIH
jgi:hypothetical protein